MKILLFLAIFISKIACSQDCDGDRPSWSLSTNFQGITGEVSHIAQKTRVGFSMGVTLFPMTLEAVSEKENKQLVLGGALSLYGTYKVVHVESKYSIHTLLGGVMDIERGIYLSGGAEFRKPFTFSAKGYEHSKMLFIRALYPLDFRVGTIFSF